MRTEEFMKQWIAPRVRADGGWLEYVCETETELHLRAKGECACCIALERCLKWVGDCARRQLGHEWIVTAEKEPFVWRK